MATPHKGNGHSGDGRGKPLSSAEQAEFDQLSRQLHDTPSGDSDQPYQPYAGAPENTVYDDQVPGTQAGGPNTAPQPGPHQQPGAQPGAPGNPGDRPNNRGRTPGRAAGPSEEEAQAANEENRQKEFEAEDLNDREQEDQDQEDQLGNGYTSEQPDENEDEGGSRFQRFKRRVKKKRAQIMATSAFVGLLTGSGFLMFSAAPFQLPNFLNGIDTHVFARSQGINMKGRSDKWLKAYVNARILDIEEAGNSKKTTDNLLFRANKVDFNNPFLDWYRTMRTSAFEADMFERHGIRFQSAAIQDGNRISIRPARITVGDTVALEFNLRAEGVDEDTIQGALRGDTRAFEAIDRATGRLDQLVQVDFMDNKQARKEVKAAVKQMFAGNRWSIWNGVKRYQMRRNIQNMTGITSWKLFETTRERWRDKALSARNKMLSLAIPSNTKTGKFLECMFGISSCTTRPDPMAPENRNLPNAGPDGGGRTDSEGNPLGDGRDELRPGLDTNGGANFANKIALKLLKTAGQAANIVSMINSAFKFHHNLTSGALSNIITVARSQQVAALYTMLAVGNDQFHLGEGADEEIDETMGMISNATNTEAWETVVNERPNVVLAQGGVTTGFIPASTKEEYCSAEHQEKLRDPANAVQAANDFGHNCDKFKVGAATNITALENAWKNGIGVVLDPLYIVWTGTIGAVTDLFEGILDAIIEPIMKAILDTLGLSQKIEDLMGWVGQQLLEFSGAGLMWDDLSPSQQMVNMFFQGGAVVAEGTTSGMGGALTTPQMKEDSIKAYRQNQAQKYAETSIFDRYLSLKNPESMASSALFSIVNRSPRTWGQGFLSSMGSIFSLPFKVISKTVSAASPNLGDPYTTARDIAGVPTFDFPKAECLDREVIGEKPPLISPGVWGKNGDGLKDGMTPQNATNADEEGVFKPEELNWDLMRDSERWKTEVYNRVKDDNAKAMRLWNCALLDNAVAGGMGGLYGYKGVGALSSSNYIKKE